MKKTFLNWATFFMVAIVSVGFASCSSDDDDENGGSLNMSEAQIRECLESDSGQWEIIREGKEDSYGFTMTFRNGKTDGWNGMDYDFSYWATTYSISGNRVYITKEEAENNVGDVLEGGIVITKLTNTTMEFYSVDKLKYIGTKQ